MSRRMLQLLLCVVIFALLHVCFHTVQVIICPSVTAPTAGTAGTVGGYMYKRQSLSHTGTHNFLVSG
eukprot:m.92775 g.92775  ORF g.92775 m.92775 type:complete len:67 (-) comp12990_c0_seq1:5135-5335(-)